MLNRKTSSKIKNEKGMAVFEMIPLLMIIVLFVNFSIGFFGAIHTGIINSIAARNYTFETFRNRPNLVYFKSTDPDPESIKTQYSEDGFRFHGSTNEKGDNAREWYATERLIDFLNSDKRAADVVGSDSSTHGKTHGVPSGRNVTVGVNPIWIKTTYGICLNAACGS